MSEDGSKREHGVCVARNAQGALATELIAGGHALRADEPVELGGAESGPNPYDLLCAALGACTSMTLRLYAQRKSYALQDIAVELKHEKIDAADCADCTTKTGKVDVIHRRITLTGALDEAARADLLRVAERCPVHRTLSGEIKIRSELSAP